jgi:hypothetical protein
MYDRYDGINGKTHGLIKENNPAKNATKNDTLGVNS